ncbi:tetratricopeptide repeat protein [Roseateles sp. LYH14W]|uniref:Tetratricopeptide repeat protein n=1 Tax=Pelomonas parva TaxID=3299032 RepID=A0ABW7EY12_9BURK
MQRDTELQAHDAWDRGDLRTALALFVTSAASGSRGCALNLGYFYDEGLGIPQSKSSALYWYRQACRLGDLSGATNIAILCRERGQHHAMFRWFRKACRANGGDDGDAELAVARCLLSGLGAGKSRDRALRHLRRALRSRHVTPASVEQAHALHRRLTGTAARRHPQPIRSRP